MDTADDLDRPRKQKKRQPDNDLENRFTSYVIGVFMFLAGVGMTEAVRRRKREAQPVARCPTPGA